MASVVHQDPKAQSVQEGQGEAVQGAIPRAGDTTNPKEWSSWRRAWVLFYIAFSSFIVSLYSTIYTSSIPGASIAFDIHPPVIPTLGITTYLIGTGAGSLTQAPLSEVFGRRPIYLVFMTVFTLPILPCSLATSVAEILVVRFFGLTCNPNKDVFGAATISNAPVGISLWRIAPFNGPAIGPVIGGFVYAGLGWRWDDWLTMILSGASLRKEHDSRYWSRYDDKSSFRPQLKVTLRRSFILAATEPIPWFFNTCLANKRINANVVREYYRGWGPGINGLAYLENGLGVTLAICLEPLWRHIINSSLINPETGRVYPEAAGSIMSLGAICTPIGIHWLVSIACGVHFGFGNTLCFIYSSNYLAGSYGIYAASALSSNTVFRSILGGTLPLAGPKIYAWFLFPSPFDVTEKGFVSRNRTILQTQKDAEAGQRRTSGS
ncbi:major facilitator superfamily domain-containing protein [Aspergillus alliaceus]|uniref:major facilitator superfamily domain-containing protein n=1 Tax=Petromyces alliaceus TaxID=209559 RepID=UPI0012A5D154|nr:major facilitator superfamily domain-containing protein [Aspergillus alliaceus]KAB8227646.1 major facilitator superfamily domain-containing protein [Aspergillus alliaceus]